MKPFKNIVCRKRTNMNLPLHIFGQSFRHIWGALCSALLLALASCSLLFSGAPKPDSKPPNLPGSLFILRSSNTQPIELGRGINVTLPADPRIQNFTYQNWTWGSGKLEYADTSLPRNGQTASVMKATASKAGASGFAMSMDATDLTGYEWLKLSYYLSHPAKSLKFKMAGSGKDTGDISGLPNQAGWNFFQVRFGGLGTLDKTKVSQFAFIYDANEAGHYLAWGDAWLAAPRSAQSPDIQ